MLEFTKDQAEALRRSGQFDEQWYLESYPDVKALGMKPLEHYLWLGARLGRHGCKPAAAPRSMDAAYSALRQEVLHSGLWDEKWYLSKYYGHYTASKKRRAHNEPFFPLDYYLQEGWKLGHEPSNLLPIKVDQKKIGCSKIEYFLNRLRFDGYQFSQNIWVPSKTELEKYIRIKQKRNSNKVIYTFIGAQYDDLMQPYFISHDWDYVCFTDDPELISKGNVGVWEIRSVPDVRSCTVRDNRWCKMHPHVLFPSHEESIYIDGNINIISRYIFDQVEKCGANILLPQHFARNCIYSEIETLLKSPRTSGADKALLISHRRTLEEEGFPSEFGLTENNLIYRRHHDERIVKLMNDWWTVFDRGPSRDQASLAYVCWKNGMSLRANMIPNCRVNYRDFWVMEHNTNRSRSASTTLSSAVHATQLPFLAPAFDRDNIAIVFSTNDQFIPYLGVAIFSLIEKTSNKFNYDIVILAQGLPASAFSKIQSLAKGRSNISIRIYDTTALISSLPRDLFHVEGYVPVETYNKCFITEILSPDYDRCVYLDSDILVLADIQELHDLDLQGRSVGASVNVANVNAAFCRKNIKAKRFDEYLFRELGVLNYDKYFQAGVLVLDMNRLRTMNLRDRTIETLKKVKQPIFFDQCIFNSIFYRDVCFFSTAWNHVWYMQQYSYLRGSVPDSVFYDYARGRVDPKIIHYAGKDKPQNKLGWALSDQFWKYAYASPFLDDIKKDIIERKNEVTQAISDASNSEWYKIRPRLLVHVHLFYRDQLDIMMRALKNISKCDCDLFVTMVDKDQDAERLILREWKGAQILVLPNVGYDVFPFLHVLKQVRLSDYDFVLKIHTKNARNPGHDEVYGIKVPGYQWRDELLDAIVGSRQIFEANLAAFLEDKKLGCIGANKFIFSTKENHEERNYKLAEWRKRCGVEGGRHYVGGSMFFARTYPFERLKALNMQQKDFESPHMCTKDHRNTAHIFERLFGIVIESEGFEISGGKAATQDNSNVHRSRNSETLDAVMGLPLAK
ncbi:glycosyltransferase [Microvirga arabica]|uniref:Glycosyltransferase n=1 Tax=Microvirga arabica TaxID=1128671 RepID=A0ABV6Y2Y2_9HYPH